MEFKAIVVQSLSLDSGTSKNGNPWQKAEILVQSSENPDYPKKVVMWNMKNAQQFHDLVPGTEYIFKVDFESREYGGKWYSNIHCYGWNSVEQAAQKQSKPSGDLAGKFPKAPKGMKTSNSDLPV